MDVSTWAREQFGRGAKEVRGRVRRAVGAAQGDGVAAHVAAGSRKRVTYGQTMAVRQYERMFEEFVGYPGVETFHPAGAPYDLVRVGSEGPILLPWRFATDSTTSHEQARMKPSRVRVGLLAGEEASDQLTFDQVELSEEEIEEQFAQQRMLTEELRRWHSLVTVGYSSNVDGVYRLVWGELTLHPNGGVSWPHSEPLPLPGTTEADQTSTGGATAAARLAPVGSPVPRRPRFNDAPLDDDLGLTARPAAVDHPQQEPSADVDETGTEDGRE